MLTRIVDEILYVFDNQLLTDADFRTICLSIDYILRGTNVVQRNQQQF